MFGRDRFGRLVARTVAEALFSFKSLDPFGNGVNEQKFFFMGDPTMRLQLPEELATIDSLNSESPDSTGGIPRINPIRLKSLGRVTVRGSVRGENNKLDPTFSGSVVLQVDDVSRRVVIPDFAPGIDWEYVSSGATVFRGQGTLNAGTMSASFIVPKDISYADSTGRGRIIMYLSGTGGDVIGFNSMFTIWGTDTSARIDTEGPHARLYLDSRGFRSGDLVRESPVLIADLVDSSGMNTSVAGIGHRLELWINNSPQGRDVSEFYLSRLDDFRYGSLQVPLARLPQGRNSLRLRAWDVYNNSATAEISFEVAGDDRLTLSEVWNYPNPFARETQFTFRQNQLVPLHVTIKIFTVSGRMIHSLEMITGGEPFVRVPWDGRDRDGDTIANGVYFYKVIASTFDGNLRAETLGKLMMMR
jgi:hypothetical protein